MRNVTFRVEIVPNPFGGVNTHLWRGEAYIVGIVPVLRPAYYLNSHGGKLLRDGFVCWDFSVSSQYMACDPDRKF